MKLKQLSNKFRLAVSFGIFGWVSTVTGVTQAFTPSLSVLETTSDAAAVWSIFDDDHRVEGATFVNGSWSAPVLLSDELVSNFVAPVISRVNQNGNAVALWSYHDGTRYLVAGSTMTNFIWSLQPTLLTSDQDAGFDDIQVRLDDSDNVSAIWTSQKLDSNVIIRGATGTILNGWTNVFQVSP